MRHLVRLVFVGCVTAATAVGLASAASPSRNVSTYVLLALDTLNMKEFSFTNNGNIGVNASGGTMAWGRQSLFKDNSEVVSDVLTRAGTHSSIWDLFTNNDVIPKLVSAQVTIRNSGPTTFTPLPLINPLPVLPTCTPGTTSVVVAKNGAQTLDHGAYSSLVVSNGSTLTLSGGTYCFRDVKTGRKANIAVQAPVQIIVAGKFRTNVATQFVLGSGVGATDVEVDIAGSQVKFGHHNRIFGRFYAPNAKLKFGRGAFYTGQFIARDMGSDFGDTFTLEACGNGVIDTGEQCDAGQSNGQPGVCCTSDCNYAPQGTPCPDSDRCNGAETCSAFGLCVPGTHLDCNDHNTCTDDSCVPATGCKHVAVQDNTPCPDGNKCNGDEVCMGGVCKDQPDLDCDDHNPCTSDSCNPTLGCQNPPVTTPIPGTCECPNGDSDCDNDNVCDGIETCDPITILCVAGTPKVCTTTNQCLTPTCDSKTGCGTESTSLQGHSCDDDDACTTGDQCTDGACGGSPLGCNDGKPCTQDSCDSSSGCTFDAIPDCGDQKGSFCSLTQGAYGNDQNKGAANGPSGLVTQNPSVLPVSIGFPLRSVKLVDQPSLAAFMPTGGPASELDLGDLVIPPDPVPMASGDGAGVLAGQTVALSLNIALSDIGATPPGLGNFHLPQTTFCTCDKLGKQVGSFTISQCILGYVTTVDNLKDLANQALGGIPLPSLNPCLTYPDINDAETAINEAFDECAEVCPCP